MGLGQGIFSLSASCGGCRRVRLVIRRLIAVTTGADVLRLRHKEPPKSACRDLPEKECRWRSCCQSQIGTRRQRIGSRANWASCASFGVTGSSVQKRAVLVAKRYLLLTCRPLQPTVHLLRFPVIPLPSCWRGPRNRVSLSELTPRLDSSLILDEGCGHKNAQADSELRLACKFAEKANAEPYVSIWAARPLKAVPY